MNEDENHKHLIEIIKYGKCDCCANPGTDTHTCPYAEDIHGDSLSLCNCCHVCEGNCADDI